MIIFIHQNEKLVAKK